MKSYSALFSEISKKEKIVLSTWGANFASIFYSDGHFNRRLTGEVNGIHYDIDCEYIIERDQMTCVDVKYCHLSESGKNIIVENLASFMAQMFTSLFNANLTADLYFYGTTFSKGITEKKLTETIYNSLIN